MAELVRSVSGIRGIWSESLFPTTVVKYAAGFGTYVKGGKIILGRDTRLTGDALRYVCIAGLLSVGCEIIDIGICPTPTCQLNVKELKADGGVIITASHNPGQWNGLKFVNAAGEFLDQENHDELIDIIDHNKTSYCSFSQIKTFHENKNLNEQAIKNHINKICNYIDVDVIRGKGFKVVVDACNGAGSTLIIPLLQELGCQIIKLNCEENGIFPRQPEPTAGNLTELCAFVKKEKTDIGFAVDPDADRLSIISERGEALGEEMTLPLVAQHVLKKKGGVTVTNLSTSMAIDYVAKQLNTKVIRTKIGEAHVVSAMKKHQCYVGGEGNGGVIVPEIQYARDSGVGIGIILDMLANTGKTLSYLASQIPNYYLVKKKINYPSNYVPIIIEHFQKKYSDVEIDRTDGIKMIWNDLWLHIRKSGTEDILRILAEATTLEKAELMVDETIKSIYSLINK